MLAGRDDETIRWLGTGSLDPSPTAMIQVGADTVGWVDADPEPDWLRAGEVNIGYAVWAPHRGRGFATAALRLLLADLPATGAHRAVLVIDRRNVASVRVARAIGAQEAPHPAARRFPTSAMYVVDVRPGAAPT